MSAEPQQSGKKSLAKLLLTLSPALLTALGILIFIALLILLVFLPFLLFADTEQLKNPAPSFGYDWTVPDQLDVDGTAYAWPVPSIERITSTFGFRDLFDKVKMHKGIDIAAGPGKTGGQPIYAMAAGVVTVAGPVSGYGQAIYIDHGGGLVSIYGHLEARMDVTPGVQVEKGQKIGLIGHGKVGTSTGEHLHFQIELNGDAVNPLNYVQPPGSSSPGSGNGVNQSGELVYRPLNIEFVLAYLNKKNSALADRSILQMIDRAGKDKNVDPHLLIAITGQEQGFVPRNNNHASLIIKNPWNVFGCWCKGKGATLTTEQSARVAADTIVKLSQDRPPGHNSIQWLSSLDNPRGFYAEHQGWWKGVTKFYNILLSGGA